MKLKFWKNGNEEEELSWWQNIYIDWDEVWEALLKIGYLLAVFGFASLLWVIVIGIVVAAITGAKF